MADRLDQIVQRLREFVAERDWDQFHDPKNLSMAIASEAGELVAEYRWVRNEESDVWSREPENQRRAAMEAADVGISLLMFCDRIGVDLIDAIENKIAVNASNYPVVQAKGKHSR